MTAAKSNGVQGPLGREAAVKQLKAFYKVSLADCDDDLGDAIFQETDRGTVVLLSTAIEDALKQRLQADMVHLSADENDRLFGPDAPLGSFSAKIKLAYALGAIDRDTQRICDLIREMRNACAHSGRAISFTDDALNGVLQAAWSFIPGDICNFSETKHIPLFARVAFIWLTAWTQHVIKRGSKDTATEMINGLVSDLNATIDEEAEKHQASLRIRRERSALKRRLNRKA